MAIKMLRLGIYVSRQLEKKISLRPRTSEIDDTDGTHSTRRNMARKTHTIHRLCTKTRTVRVAIHRGRVVAAKILNGANSNSNNNSDVNNSYSNGIIHISPCAVLRLDFLTGLDDETAPHTQSSPSSLYSSPPPRSRNRSRGHLFKTVLRFVSRHNIKLLTTHLGFFHLLLRVLL